MFIAAPAAALPWDKVQAAFPDAPVELGYVDGVTVFALAPLTRAASPARVPVFLTAMPVSSTGERREPIELSLCRDVACEVTETIRVSVHSRPADARAVTVWSYPAGGHVRFAKPGEARSILSVPVTNKSGRWLAAMFGRPGVDVPTATWTRDERRPLARHDLRGGVEVVDATALLRETPDLLFAFDALVLADDGLGDLACVPTLRPPRDEPCGALDEAVAAFAQSGGVVLAYPGEDFDSVSASELRAPDDVVLVDRDSARVLDEYDESVGVGRRIAVAEGSLVVPRGRSGAAIAGALLAAAPRFASHNTAASDVRVEPAAHAAGVSVARRVPVGPLTLLVVLVAVGGVAVVVRRRRAPVAALSWLARASVVVTVLALVGGHIDPGATCRVRTWTFVGEAPIAREVVADGHRVGAWGAPPSTPSGATVVHGLDGRARGDVTVHVRVSEPVSPGRLVVRERALTVTNELPFDLDAVWLVHRDRSVYEVGPLPRGVTAGVHHRLPDAPETPHLDAGARRLVHDLWRRRTPTWTKRHSARPGAFGVGRNAAGELVGVEVLPP